MIVPAVYIPPGAASPRMGAVEGALWPTTGDINNETASLGTSILQLSQDIFNSDNQYSAAFQTSWNAFVADFNNWKDASWFWNPTRRDELIEYRSRFNDLLAQAKSIGVQTLARDQSTEAPPGPLDEALKLANKIVIAGAVIGVLYVGYKVWEKTRK